MLFQATPVTDKSEEVEFDSLIEALYFEDTDSGYDFQEEDSDEYHNALEELRSELFEDCYAYASSNETGWFYSDSDPGWENNIPDRYEN